MSLSPDGGPSSVLQPRGERPPRFASVDVGVEFGPATLEVAEHLVAAYTFAVEDRGAVQEDHCTPAVLANDLLLLYYQRYRNLDCAAVGTRNTLLLRHPVRIGETVVLTGRHVEKYRKRGRGYVVSVSEARREDGTVLAVNRATEIMDGLGGTTPDRATGSVASSVGAVLGSAVRPTRFDQVCVFSRIGRHERNIHNDAAFAQQRGFGRPVVQGVQQLCWVADLGTQLLGPAFWRTGTVDLRFVSPLWVDDRASLVLTGDEDPSAARAEVRAGDGRLTSVGTVRTDSNDPEWADASGAGP